MNFLFTVALNNDNGDNYKTIMQLFRDLALTLNSIGHNTFILSHPAAYMQYDLYSTVYQTETLTIDNYNEIMGHVGFKPDYAFIWNGNTINDTKTITLLKSNGIKIIYGELGFLNHFNQTCYFDLSGVNCRISDISSKLDMHDLSKEENAELTRLCNDHIKPRLVETPYIFIPLQIESDTQITKYSPFKTMDELLEYVTDIFKNDTRLILYKHHPMKRSITKQYDKIVEVSNDVHHYIPYADVVVGINSTVLTETLIYHNRLISLGAGITSKQFVHDNQRKRYILQLNNKQLNWSDLADVSKIENSYFYQQILKDYTR
jgi:hypothetical protein